MALDPASHFSICLNDQEFCQTLSMGIIQLLNLLLNDGFLLENFLEHFISVPIHQFQSETANSLFLSSIQLELKRNCLEFEFKVLSQPSLNSQSEVVSRAYID